MRTILAILVVAALACGLLALAGVKIIGLAPLDLVSIGIVVVAIALALTLFWPSRPA